jgi:acetyl-CoA synthetase
METEANQTRSLIQNTHKFHPPSNFSEQANLKSFEEYKRLYDESINSPDTFWGRVASDLHWFSPWRTVLDASNPPFFKWFVGSQTNICYNCIDRNLELHENKPAIVFEGEPGDSKVYTYRELFEEVCKFANTLLHLGVRKGDRVAIYMPLVPESVFSILACARIGAVHNVIFGGFAIDSIKGRIQDSSAKLVITADGGYRRGRVIKLKDLIDEGIVGCDSVEKVLVIKRNQSSDIPVKMVEGRDFWYHEVSADRSLSHEPQHMDSEDMLFLLYTSGTTGTPKGVVHTTGGYMVGAYLTSKIIFDLKSTDVYWCTADIGWITGHSYVVYGPLLNAATVVIFEGAPDYPDYGRFWDIIEKYKVSIFYTAPTAIRTFMKWGEVWPNSKDLSSLRLLGSVGEPINPEAWLWYHKVIGHENCPIVDTWWQTETGSILISPIPGITVTKPGSATLPFFGIQPAVLTDEGEPTDYGTLAILKPWPSMLRGIYNSDERYKNGYWGSWGGKYYNTNDGAIVDDEGYYWIIGRLDDIVNVAGHRISTAELEGVVIEHPSVVESAFVGIPHEIKGQGLTGFVILKQGIQASNTIRQEINEIIGKRLGKFELPDKITFVSDLPKTRSGKIMRRLLRDIAENRALGNTTTLADPAIIDHIIQAYKSNN